MKPYKDVNDLIKEEPILNSLINDKYLNINERKLTSLKGIEQFKNLTVLHCSGNYLTTLDGIETLVNLQKLACNDNCLTSLKGIENLNNLNNLLIFTWHDNPLTNKYKGLSTQEIVQQVYAEVHLNKDDELRGKAALIHSGLFDFKTK